MIADLKNYLHNMANFKPKFTGTAQRGNFVPTNVLAVAQHMRQFQEGQELEITISKKYKKRTSGQHDEMTNFNGYLFGIVYKMIGDEIGEMDLDYIHAWVQIATGNFKVMRECTKIPAGTRHMSGGEFAEYCSRVRMWANQELHLMIPEPNEIVYED